jgi:hypothetical protein
MEKKGKISSSIQDSINKISESLKNSNLKSISDFNVGNIPNLQTRNTEFDLSKLNTRNFKSPLEKSENLSKKQLEKQSELLDFLILQNLNSEKQYKVSRNLIIVSIFLVLFQIFYSIYSENKPNKIQNELSRIVETQSKTSEAISNTSLNLLDLQNQVQILEKENAQLNLKLKK